MLHALRDPRLLLARPGGIDGLRGACEVAIVVLLAVQAARLAWLLVPPATLGTAVADAAPAPGLRPERLAIDAFHPRSAPVASADAPGLRLYAVRPAAGGGSAILARDGGPQRAYATGDEVASGIVLADVARDHVVLDSRGTRSQLRFPPRAPGATPPLPPRATVAPAAAAAPAPSAAAETPVVDPAQLLAGMGLRPEERDGRVTGYTVVPRGNDAVLRQAGLQAGDVLLSVNNEALDPERHAALAETLARATRITFTYRRDGQIRSATLQAPTP